MTSLVVFIIAIIFVKNVFESSLKGDSHRMIAGPKVGPTFWPLLWSSSLEMVAMMHKFHCL